jgi:hypothetical protein
VPEPPSNAPGKRFEEAFADLRRRVALIEARSDVPTGAMMFLPGVGAQIPSGFVVGGAVLDRGRFGGLFTVYGTDYPGNGSTTFGTPTAPPGVPPPDPAAGRWIIRA